MKDKKIDKRTCKHWWIRKPEYYDGFLVAHSWVCEACGVDEEELRKNTGKNKGDSKQ